MKKMLLAAVALLFTLSVAAQDKCEGEKKCCKKAETEKKCCKAEAEKKCCKAEAEKKCCKKDGGVVVLRIEDMHCQKCANRIKERLAMKVQGVDSLLPDFQQHTLEVRYNAALTNKDAIRTAITKAGYTPVNYCKCGKLDYAYLIIPKEAATQETVDKVKAIKGVKDANTATVRRSLAVAYQKDVLTADQLLAAVQQAGIQATLPKPHVCEEEEKKK